jgi:prepilin-type N-terminal cleavage/methylation domain-containing protein
MKKNTKGFTLIELLIVIALLGALAVGLLAALDPFEQLKKGTDTGIRNTVSEVHGAVIRYYGIRNEMPWYTVSSAITMPVTNLSSGYTAVGLPQIISSGELKSDFSTLAAGQLKDITIAGGSDSVTVCFKPTSKSFRTDQNTKYDPSSLTDKGTNDTTHCGNPADDTFSCLWCVR